MSAHHNEHGGSHHGTGGAAHGTRRDYVTGFILSVVLTAVPFALVMGGLIRNPLLLAATVIALAIVQIVVHMVYFLHMNARSENGWTLMALIFTVIIVMIGLAGSLWVMINMNHYMMPPMTEQHAAGAASTMPGMNGPDMSGM